MLDRLFFALQPGTPAALPFVSCEEGTGPPPANERQRAQAASPPRRPRSILTRAFRYPLLALICLSPLALRAESFPASGRLSYTLTSIVSRGYLDTQASVTKVHVAWKGNRVREERRSPGGTVVLISDGRTACRYNPKTRGAVFLDSLPDVKAVVSPTPASFRDVRRVVNGQYLGQPCEIRIAQSPMGAGKARIWVSRKTGICLKFTVGSGFGNTIREVTSIKTGVALPDSLFTLPAPRP
ncbi:MAG: hypothetical protein IT210_22750 [Armatimonadetes bacterium]|nr:hypothetical protein [Armatimonadota bacterium]